MAGTGRHGQAGRPWGVRVAGTDRQAGRQALSGGWQVRAERQAGRPCVGVAGTGRQAGRQHA